MPVKSRLVGRSAPSGVISSYAYDGLDRLTALNHTLGVTTLISNQYQYNNANNITSWSNASGNHAYGYDPLNRLALATNSAQPNEDYTYDGVGNRTASHLSANYNYQPFNKLTSTATGAYTYDNNGNLVSRTDSLGTTTFSWNHENQLTQVTLPIGLTVNYKYDGLGRRIQRTTTAGANERYVYDGSDVLLDLNADWSVANTYVNGPGIDNHLRQTSATIGVSYFLTDQIGSTSGLTDESGSLLEQLSYDSFGNSAGSARTRYGYTGRERDPDTGLHYYRARWHDPQVGRFISEDPIGFLGRDVNLYGYVRNDPLRMIDPSGLRRCHPLLGALVGGLYGAGVGAGAGAVLGGVAAGAVGAAGGSFVIPGFGTIGGGLVGIGVGVNAGAAFGAAIGTGIGIGMGIDYCNVDDACDRTDTKPWSPNPPPPPNRERECMIQWENDNSLCRMLPNPAARKRCWASAIARLAACLRGQPYPPLISD